MKTPTQNKKKMNPLGSLESDSHIADLDGVEAWRLEEQEGIRLSMADLGDEWVRVQAGWGNFTVRLFPSTGERDAAGLLT